MLKKNYIQLNIFSYTIFVLIIKKFDDDLRIYVNYRALNALIIRNRNAFSLIRNILIKLCIIKWYIKFDIIIAFNEIKIKKEYEKKITFFIKYNLFEYVIMFFELCNTLSTFQTFINDILREYLNVFCFAYFDDILIYNNIKKEHIKYMRKVLKKL